MKNIFREFKPTSWSINNKTTIYLVTAIVTLFGLISYVNLPKENFPDIVLPQVYVTTVYAGSAPADIENLITRKIEKQIKSLSGVRKVTSNSVQDLSNILVEFNTNVKIAEARQRVKDAVDKARTELPDDLTKEPMLTEVSFSEFPIMYVNLYGDVDLDKLKKYADDAKDKLEAMKEISRVDIVGAVEREIQINVDTYKMQSAQVTFDDIERGVKYENMTISGGLIKVDEMKRAVRIVGEFKSAEDIKNIVIKSLPGASVYLRDIAEVKDDFKEKESFARLNHKNVVTLNVIKRSGENLIESSDKIKAIMADLQENTFPPALKVSITGDQSTQTRTTLNDLINSIIIGFILVTLVLMFFVGTTNAIFVGLSVPISMFLAFIMMPTLGFSLNMIVLFAFLFALGIVVDDAIVVIENTHRIFHEEDLSVSQAAKKAAGEVFVPVLAGTLTTIAPFVPLAFWPGLVGKFMFYLPITLIVTLLASLVVAFIINPVFAVSFMRKEGHHAATNSSQQTFYKKNKSFIISILVILGLSLIFHIFGSTGIGNFFIFLVLILLLNKFVLIKLINKFQQRVLPKFMNGYERLLKWALSSRRKARALLLSTIALLLLTFVALGIVKPSVVFFPNGDPNFIYTYITLPVGTDQVVTDSVTKIVEDRIFKVVGEKNPIVESVIANVGIGVSDPSEGEFGTTPHKGRVAVSFVEFAHRDGKSTREYLDKIREAVKGIPGAEITVDQEKNGPPTGKPISIEISGEDFGELIALSNSLENYIDSLQIPGIEDLRSDLQDKKPEITVLVDRERANNEGILTAQIGGELRTALFGKEISKYKENEDEYPIQLRFRPDQRSDIDKLLNTQITFRDMALGGMVRQIPLSAIATVKYSNTYGGIKRKNLKRVVTLSSNVLSGYNPNEIVAKIKQSIVGFPTKSGYEIKFGGEQEDQEESSNFLGGALLMSLGLIFLILVTQFNSISKPVIILSEVVFSIIGVLIGFMVFGMTFSIVMNGIGIVGLAGIVVKNGILIIEFADELRKREKLGIRDALIKAGKTRLSPVVLTASATILGLVPLAIGFNINFVTLFTELNPHIFIGGDSVAFWGPLAWSIAFGLSFATFLTLVLVPAMYLLTETWKENIKKRKEVKQALQPTAVDIV